MLNDYLDIRRRIPEPPEWFDENGVPRYDEPHPSLCPNIYADEVVFFEIACQCCGARYVVERNWQRRDSSPSLTERVNQKDLHYGDPPCWACAAGSSMTSDSIRTLQFWTRLNSNHSDWALVPELEGLSLDKGDDAPQ